MTDQNKAAPAPSSLAGGEVLLPDEIDLFRIMRAAGRSNADKAKAVAAHLAALSPEAPAREGVDYDALLKGRDDFIVSKGLWGEFVSTLTDAPRHEAPSEDGPVFHMNLLSHEDNEAWLESARRPSSAPTTRETADHAELARLAKAKQSWSLGIYKNREQAADAAKFSSLDIPATVLALLSEIAALRGDLAKTERDYSELRDSFDAVSNKLCVERAHGGRQSVRATQAERQRDELRKAAENAANLFKLCTEPTMFENASTLNVYAQMTEWLVRNRPLIANQGVDQ